MGHDNTSKQEPEDYDLSLAEACALTSWDVAEFTHLVVDGMEDYGFLPALGTRDGLRFKTRDLIQFIARDVDVSQTEFTPEFLEWLRHAFTVTGRLSGRLKKKGAQ